jgi:hypothetical protein
LQSHLHSRGGPVQITPDFTQIGDKILAAALRQASGGTRRERLMVFTVRAGKIVDMQGFS